MWQRLPCRYPDLSIDPAFRAFVRWATERVRFGLLGQGRQDPLAVALIALTSRILETLEDVPARKPRNDELSRLGNGRFLSDAALQRGLQALAWVVDERGLGGGQEMDGLSWQLPLEVLWERYVEAKIRDEVSQEGGDIRVGRLGQTVFPLHWSTSSARSLSHLVPDIVVRKGREIRIVDAKYKSHFADLDEHRWYQLSENVRDAHRADVHQVLAYAALFDATEVKATLVYPLRRSTWERLRERGRDKTRATLFHGSRSVQLEIRGLPFGGGIAKM